MPLYSFFEQGVVQVMLPSIMIAEANLNIKDDGALYTQLARGMYCASLVNAIASRAYSRHINGQIVTTSILIFVSLLYWCPNPPFMSISATVLQTVLCCGIHYQLFKRVRRKFTYGEATVIGQLVSTCFAAWYLITFYKFQTDINNKVLLELGVMFFFLCILPGYLSGAQEVQYLLMGLAPLIWYLRLSYILNKTPVYYMVEFALHTPRRFSLTVYWLFVVVGCFYFSARWAMTVGETNPTIRKVFHLAIVTIFLTGYNEDPEYLTFASGMAIIFLIYLEVTRAWKLDPIGPLIEGIFSSLRGPWDNEHMTMSHIYLLVGVTSPLWLIGKRNQIDQSAGLFSVGVGDTAAALIGIFYGRVRLMRNSDKTLEGLIANVFSQICFKFFWIRTISIMDEFRFSMSAVIVSLCELFIRDCDNLVLPLIMILCLRLFDS